MSIKTIAVTALVLGSTSIAAASPTVRDHRDHSTTTTVVHDIDAGAAVRADLRADLAIRPIYHPAPQPTVRPLPYPQPSYAVPAPTWITLANDARITGRTLIDLPAMQGRQFSKLVVRAEQGRTDLDKVIIVYGNGRKHTIDLNAKLNAHSAPLTIDLAGRTRGIDRVILVGDSRGRRASIDVLAR